MLRTERNYALGIKIYAMFIWEATQRAGLKNEILRGKPAKQERILSLAENSGELGKREGNLSDALNQLPIIICLQPGKVNK